MANLITRTRDILFRRSEKRARIGLDNHASVLSALNLFTQTKAGANVTPASALSISTVYACAAKIASTMAQLNLDLIRTSGRSRETVRIHPAQYVTSRQPNSLTTPFEFWESIIANAVLRGVGYAYIQRDGSGQVQLMQVVPNDSVERKELNGAYVYRINDDQTVSPDDMLEICNLYRMSPISLHRENIGLAKAAQDYGAQYFGNGGQMTGVLSSDTPLRSEQMEIIQKSWSNSMSTAGTKLLPFGFKYSRIGIAPDEAQFIETRQFQAQEICRMFGVSPALVGLESQTTYNNVEQQSLQFVRHTLTPWARRIEQELDKKLLTTFEQDEMNFRFRLSDLHRGDSATRAAYYQTMLQSGVMSINEIREQEMLNPTASGDVHLIQVNQFDLTRVGQYSDAIAGANTETESNE